MIAGAFSSTSGKADTTMTTDGQILYYNSGRQALNIGDEGKVLTVSDSDLPAWETAGGDEDLTFIAEVNLASGANQVIEKTSGLDTYEAVIVIFNLWEGSGTNFVPELQTYTNGALDTSYGLTETIQGATITTAGSSVIPCDANTTANNMCSGSIVIRTESTLACQSLDVIYQVNNVATTAAPFQSIVSAQTPDDYPIQGIRFTNNGTSTPTFGTSSYLLFYGVKKA